MNTKIHVLAPDVIELRIHGRLEKADYEQFVPLAERRIAQHGKISLLVHVELLRGWSLGGLWEDLKFDAKHYTHVRRIALVADRASKHWLATLSRPFTGAEIRFFTEDALEDAREWLREGSSPAAALSGTG